MKDILVSLDTTDQCKIAIDAAVYLAGKFDSHLTGLYVEKNLSYGLYAEPLYGAMMTAFEDQLAEDSDKITKMFNEGITPRRSKSTLVINKQSNRNNVFTYLNVSDVVVCSQLDPNTQVFGDMNQPEHIIMGSGRPVLTIPYIGFPKSIGENVVIAWDGSREASRAVHDAMPLLTKASKVHIFAAESKKQINEELIAADLAEHLARHNVNVEASPSVLKDVPVGEALLSRVNDYGADLIVMGAYGHSRLREYTLGGTTRTILESMTVPVLMTH